MILRAGNIRALQIEKSNLRTDLDYRKKFVRILLVQINLNFIHHKREI